MSKKCPICGKGAFRELALKKHIRRYHPESAPPKSGLGYLEARRREKEKKEREQRKKERGKK